MRREARERPAGVRSDGATSSTATNQLSGSSLPPAVRGLADLDAYAEHLRGRFVVQVVVDAERGHRRTTVYRSCAAAERAVKRARERGQTSHISLVQMLPVGVVGGGLR